MSNFFHFDLHEQRAVGRLFKSVHLGSSIALSRVIPVAINESRRHSDRIRPAPLQIGPSTDSASPPQRPPRRYYTLKSQPGPSITRLTPDFSKTPHPRKQHSNHIIYNTPKSLFRKSLSHGQDEWHHPSFPEKPKQQRNRLCDGVFINNESGDNIASRMSLHRRDSLKCIEGF